MRQCPRDRHSAPIALCPQSFVGRSKRSHGVAVALEGSDLDRTTYPTRCSRKKPIVRFHASAAAASL